MYTLNIGIRTFEGDEMQSTGLFNSYGYIATVVFGFLQKSELFSENTGKIMSNAIITLQISRDETGG